MTAMTMMNRIRRIAADKWPLLLGIALLAAFYWDVLLGRTAILFRDMEKVYLPTRMEFSRRLLAGELPEWYPFDGLGSSYVGNVVTAILHPSVLLHLVFPDSWALSFSAILSHLIAGIGVFLLLRHWACGKTASLIGAMAYAASGYLISMDGNLPYLLAASAIPWGMFFFETALSRLSAISDEPPPSSASPKQPFAALPLAAAALAMACLALSGDPQALYITSLILLAMALLTGPALKNRLKALACLSASGILAALFSAPQLLPAIWALGDRNQDAHTLSGQLRFAFSPLRLLEFLTAAPPRLPNGDAPEALFDLHGFDSFWSDSSFLGAAVLALAATALALSSERPTVQKRAIRLLAGIFALSLCLALGSSQTAPLYGLFQRVLPGWSFLRYPEKTLVFTALSAALLSGFGAEFLLENASPARRFCVWKTYRIRLALLLGFLTLGALAWTTHLGQRFLLILSGTRADDGALRELLESLPAAQTGLFIGLLNVLLCLALALPTARLLKRPRLASTLLIISTALPLFLASWGTNARRYRSDPAIVLAPAPIIDTIRREAAQSSAIGAPRVFSQTNEAEIIQILGSAGLMPPPGLNTSTAIDRANALNLNNGTAGLFGIETVIGYIPLTTGSRQGMAVTELPDSVFWNGFAITSAVFPNPAPERLDDAFLTRRNPFAAPRIRLAQAIRVQSRKEALALTRRSDFDVQTQVPVETAAADFPEERPQNASVRVLLYSPEHIRVRVTTETPAALFVADGFAPGWTAALDGQSVPIYPALIAGRAIAVPAGEHEAEFRFRTPGLRAGLMLSLLGLILTCILIIFEIRRRRKNAVGIMQ